MSATSYLWSLAGRAVRAAVHALDSSAEGAAIIASSDDAFIGVSRRGLITSWNAAAERLYGYRRGDVVGRPVDVLFPPDRRAEQRRALDRAWGGEHVRPYDTQAARRQGSLVDVAIAVSPILRHGRVVGAVLGIRDITGRRAAEEALRAGEARLRAVVETARNAFVGIDEQGRITDWNRRAEELFAWPRGEAVGRLLVDTIVPPARRSSIPDDLRQFLATGESRFVGQTVETVAQRRDGTAVHVELSVWHLEEAGRHRFYAFVQDISERKRVEELQCRVAAIVESSDEAIVGLAPDLSVTHWNSGAERLYGYPAGEALGRNVGFLVAGGARPTLLDAVVRGERINGVETRIRHQDGRLVPVSLSASPIVDGAGSITGISSVAHDITERREIAAALASARDEALEASRLKSRFLATMSHEIRTPMNGVIGLTGLLLDTGLDPLPRRYAEGIRNAGESLLAVINDILDFSKVEAGKLELEAVDFDLAPLVEEVAELVADGARDKGLEIIAGCASEVAGRFRGDAKRIRQVLLNLVANAVKFTLQGEVVVRAGLVTEPDGRTAVRFDVSDTGIGISPDEQAKLFQPFSQADASTTRRFGGTGLGLAISAQLVEAMGGTLGLHSEAGQGSTFWFAIPLERRPERIAPDPSAHVLDAVRVLVVDDNETNRLILQTLLRAWGLRPRVVDSGARALEAMGAASAAGDPYRVVISDHQMPGMDGRTLADHLRRDPATPAVPVVLLSSGGELAADRVQPAGIAAVLTKPVRQSELYDVLLRLLAGPDLFPVAHVAAPAASGAPSGRGCVLVAEDNEINQMVARGVLAKLGYEAHIVGDGAEAVAAASATEYAAILMDCHMPGVDGYAATAEIRAGEAGSGRRVPIIAMTAGVLVEDRERALAAGMDDYVAKPVDPALLEAVLGRWASPRAAEPPAHDGPPPDAAAPGGESPLDPDRLAMLRRLGPADGFGLLPQLARSFQVEAPAVGSALRHLVSNGEAGAVSEAAHRLRGTSSNIGAVGLAALCAELEASAARALGGAEAIVDRLENELTRACRALETALRP